MDFQKLNSLVCDFVKNDLLVKISSDYNIDYNELVDKYIGVGGSVMMGSSADAPKKRGRKKKQKDEFIRTEEYEFDGVKYLLDENNNVYTYNIEKPKLIGEKLVDGTIKFIEEA